MKKMYWILTEKDGYTFRYHGEPSFRSEREATARLLKLETKYQEKFSIFEGAYKELVTFLKDKNNTT